MKTSILVPVLSFVFASLAFANGSYLADRHAQKNIGCVSCHLTEKPSPGSETESSSCLNCHPRQVIIDKYINEGKRNPHNNHLGEIDCSICHKGHEQSEAYCMNCHKSHFQMNMK